MRCSKPFTAAFAFAFALFSVASAAGAQTKGTDYIYDFPEDDLVGRTLSTTPPLLLIRRPSPRILLLRPRAHFVAEMLKSVEAL